MTRGGPQLELMRDYMRRVAEKYWRLMMAGVEIPPHLLREKLFMGCDIHSKIEIRDSVDSPWRAGGPDPFHTDTLGGGYTHTCGMLEMGRSYSQYAVLAGVRNYSDVMPLWAGRGLPSDSPDAEDWFQDGYYHSPTWFTLHEIMMIDWDAPCEDRRVTREVAGITDGGQTCEPGQGRMTTYRDMVGESFFRDVETLRAWAERQDIEPENVRVIIAFDS